MTLNELAREIHENAVAHGWWEKDRGFATTMMLVVSELSEAMEEDRAGRPAHYHFCMNPRIDKPLMCEGVGSLCWRKAVTTELCLTNEITREEMLSCPYREKKPEGRDVEVIDALIRILDWCGKEGIDVDALVREKHEYNKTRPFMHGGKKY